MENQKRNNIETSRGRETRRENKWTPNDELQRMSETKFRTAKPNNKTSFDSKSKWRNGKVMRFDIRRCAIWVVCRIGLFVIASSHTDNTFRPFFFAKSLQRNSNRWLYVFSWDECVSVARSIPMACSVRSTWCVCIWAIITEAMRFDCQYIIWGWGRLEVDILLDYMAKLLWISSLYFIFYDCITTSLYCRHWCCLCSCRLTLPLSPPSPTSPQKLRRW